MNLQVKTMSDTVQIMLRAHKAHVALPAFNIPYLPMMEPVTKAIVAEDSFALIEVARLEFVKFEAVSQAAIKAEFDKWQNPDHMRLHQDHVPVIDEDGLHIDFAAELQSAIDLGFGSVMVDGSRLSLDENIAATRQAVELAQRSDVACEAELGAVMGHEAGPMPPYEELFASGKGFTDVAEAKRFVQETGCDWLSVAVGSVHGAIAAGLKDQPKPRARVNLEHLEKLAEATGIPLVLHGGSGIEREYVLGAVKRGVAKINVGTEIRQPYEQKLKESGDVAAAQEVVYQRTRWLIREFFGWSGTAKIVAL
jgi:fructose-bisphosphate aldolase, class II